MMRHLDTFSIVTEIAKLSFDLRHICNGKNDAFWTKTYSFPGFIVLSISSGENIVAVVAHTTRFVVEG